MPELRYDSCHPNSFGARSSADTACSADTDAAWRFRRDACSAAALPFRALGRRFFGCDRRDKEADEAGSRLYLRPV